MLYIFKCVKLNVMKIETKITKMLGIDIPIIGAPMFLVSFPKLVAAISNTGGLGSFPAMNYRSVGELEKAIVEIKSLTAKPFGVNIILHKPHNPDWEKQFEVCLEHEVPLIITSMGTPRTIVKKAHSRGAKVFCDVVSHRQAEVIAKSGADALIAVAQGAGGHAGSISPFALIPYIKEIGLPVLGAGGIATGKQMAAAFSLGADAVYIGTRFIASHESGASTEYREALIKSIPENIVYTEKVSGIHANWLKESVEIFEKSKGDQIELNKEFKNWIDIWSAGHGVAQIKTVESVQNIINSIVSEYFEIKNSLP